MIAQSLPAIAKLAHRRYRAPVVTLLATGRRNLTNQTAHKRPYPIAGAFFVPVASSYGGCVWARASVAGFRLGRFLPCTQLPPYPVGRTVAVPEPNGAVPMINTHALNPSAPHAAAFRAMALAALRADSSLSVRLARYNHHMAKARALESAGGAV
jgi:hypothetical protein